MEITERLLRNEVHHLGEDLKALSTELICITKFLKLQFGDRFAEFRENQAWTINSDPPSKKPSPGPNTSRNGNPRTASTSSETSRPRIKGSSRTNIKSDGESKIMLKNPRQITELPDLAQNDIAEVEFEVVEGSTTFDLGVPVSPFIIEEDSQSIGNEIDDVDVDVKSNIGEDSDSDVSKVDLDSDDSDDSAYGMIYPRRKIRKRVGSRKRAEQESETSQAGLKSTPTRIHNGNRSKTETPLKLPTISRAVRAANFSKKEVEALVKSYTKHHTILQGTIKGGSGGLKLKKKKWAEILEAVNVVGGKSRTLPQIREKLKNLRAVIRKSGIHKTGEEDEDMSEIHQTLLQTISK